MPFGYAPPQYRGQDPNDPQLLHVVERGGPQYGIAMDQPSYDSPYRIPGRHTSTIDNGAITQSPYTYDQPEVHRNLLARRVAQSAVAQPTVEVPDALETLSTRYRPTSQYSDILAGKTRAGLESLPFLNDPQFTQLDPKSQSELARRYSGHSLEENQQASALYGDQPTTWMDIQQQQYAQKRQAASLAQLRALGGFTGERQLGDILQSWDPATNEAQISGGLDRYGEPLPPRPVSYSPEFITGLQRSWNAAGLPQMRAPAEAPVEANRNQKINRTIELLRARGASNEQISAALSKLNL